MHALCLSRLSSADTISMAKGLLCACPVVCLAQVTHSKLLVCLSPLCSFAKLTQSGSPEQASHAPRALLYRAVPFAFLPTSGPLRACFMCTPGSALGPHPLPTALQIAQNMYCAYPGLVFASLPTPLHCMSEPCLLRPHTDPGHAYGCPGFFSGPPTSCPRDSQAQDTGHP